MVFLCELGHAGLKAAQKRVRRDEHTFFAVLLVLLRTLDGDVQRVDGLGELLRSDALLFHCRERGWSFFGSFFLETNKPVALRLGLLENEFLLEQFGDHKRRECR